MRTALRRRIRTVLAGAFFALFGVGSFVFGLLLVPLLVLLPEIARRRVAGTLNRALWRVLTALMSAFRLVKVRISREDAAVLRRSRGAIVAANHPSLLDVVCLLVQTPRPVCFVKGALLHNVFMRRVVSIAHLPGSLPAAVLFRKSAQLLAAGFNILIFPEGTRTIPGRRAEFHRGAAHLALRTGAPILPVKISVEPQILGKHQAWSDVSDRCVIYTLRVFPPLLPQDFSENEKTETAPAAGTENARPGTENPANAGTPHFHVPAKKLSARLEELLLGN